MPHLTIDPFRNGDTTDVHPKTVTKKQQYVVAIFDNGDKESYPWDRIVRVTEEYADAE